MSVDPEQAAKECAIELGQILLEQGIVMSPITLIRPIYALIDRIAADEPAMTPERVKYGRDHSARITLGEVVALVLKEADQDRFLDVLDAEFLIGAWGYALKEGQPIDLLRDLRGFIWTAVQQARHEGNAKGYCEGMTARMPGLPIETA